MEPTRGARDRRSRRGRLTVAYRRATARRVERRDASRARRCRGDRWLDPTSTSPGGDRPPPDPARALPRVGQGDRPARCARAARQRAPCVAHCGSNALIVRVGRARRQAPVCAATSSTRSASVRAIRPGRLATGRCCRPPTSCTTRAASATSPGSRSITTMTMPQSSRSFSSWVTTRCCRWLRIVQVCHPRRIGERCRMGPEGAPQRRGSRSWVTSGRGSSRTPRRSARAGGPFVR